MANVQSAATSKKKQVLPTASSESLDLGERFDDLKDRAKELAGTSVSLVKKYPLYAIAGAVAIGIVTAMVLRGREE